MEKIAMAKTQMGQCALCRQNKELQLSHIVPRFVGRRLIKSAPGNIRITNEPNKVAQDIEKHYLLCHDCEELFSAKERWFANTIFNPYQDHNKTVFDYNGNLTYFIISLSWRSLYLDLEEYACDPEFNQDVLMILFRAEQTMRDYLLGKRQDIDTIENHIFFFDRIQSVQNLNASKHPSIAMHRSISSYTAYKMVSVVGQEIQHWMNQAEEAQNKLSETQRRKIQERMQALGDDIKNYPIFQDWMDDAALK